MSHFKKDFVGPPKKGQRVINIFEGPKMHTIYEVTITWTINGNTSHHNWVEISNYFYVTNRREHLISTQHWAQNATHTNTNDNTLD